MDIRLFEGFWKITVPIGIIPDEELPLHTAGRNKYICIFLE